MSPTFNTLCESFPYTVSSALAFLFTLARVSNCYSHVLSHCLVGTETMPIAWQCVPLSRKVHTHTHTHTHAHTHACTHTHTHTHTLTHAHKLHVQSHVSYICALRCIILPSSLSYRTHIDVHMYTPVSAHLMHNPLPVS
jgi:hypothetical protein